MTYPALPFPNHTWRISHHQGILTPRTLNALLFAASTYRDSRDPAHEINTYLVTSDIVPPNIREDSQQSDVWRDYQQLLSELGLIPTRRGTSREIEINPIGLSFLDGGIAFRDLMTIQSFRSQYPNGQHTQRTSGDRSSGNFAEQQAGAGILIKPAVFVWQVLDLIDGRSAPSLSAAEIELFLMPAIRHSDAEMAAEAVIRNREQRLVPPSGQTKQRRNASDWMKRLDQTHAFILNSEDRLAFSRYSNENRALIRGLTSELSNPASFWIYPSNGDYSHSWNMWFGVFDSRRYPIPGEEQPRDFGSQPEPEDDVKSSGKNIVLQPYEWRRSASGPGNSAPTITAVYSSDLSNSAHRLHESMVRLIADACRRHNLEVFADPATLDLLVSLSDQEWLIEVKSATSENLAHKIRLALGQVTFYDYLRSKQTTKPRRRGIALTLGVDESHWSRDFLPGYLDVDLITLKDGRLLSYSQSRQVADVIS